jgi:hypothetical protein
VVSAAGGAGTAVAADCASTGVATIISAPHSNVAIVRAIVRFSPDILSVIVEASAPHNNGLPKDAAGR